MALASLNDVTAGLAAGDRQRFNFNKASMTGLGAGSGRFGNYWRSAGTPGAANIPSTVEICNKSTLGAWTFNSPDTVNNKALYWGSGYLTSSGSGIGMEVHDRLVQMGGLVGNIATSQTVGLVVSGSTSNLVQRLGAADYSELQWWLEVHTVLGGTATVATVSLTHTDNSTGTYAVSLPITIGPGNSFLLAPAATGKFIKQIDSVTLSVSTGVAGNFGFAVTRRLFGTDLPTASYGRKLTWADTDLSPMYDNACVNFIVSLPGTVSGSMTGGLNLIHV